MGGNKLWASLAVGVSILFAVAICIAVVEIGVAPSVSAPPSERSANDPSPRTQPPSVPVGTGWTVAEPATASNIAATYYGWMPLVTSSLKVLEHEATEGQRATLTSIIGDGSQNITPTSGKYAGSTVAILSLDGVVSAGRQTWTMTATSQNPLSAGGSVNFVSFTGHDVLVSLVGAPSDPYSAIVGHWANELVP